MANLGHRLAPFVALLLLTGCSAAIEALDNTLSEWAGGDCRTGRLLMGTMPCQPMVPEPAVDKPAEPEPPTLYCYRTIGAVDCYEAPEPIPHRRTG